MFKFRGKSTKEFDIRIQSPDNLIVKASQRYEEIVVDGRHGSIYNPLGYAPVEISLTLYLEDPSRVDDIFQWLSGSGELEYKGRVSNVRIYAEIDPVKLANLRVIELSIIRSPFWHKAKDPYTKITTRVENEGNVLSQPIIKLTRGTSAKVEVAIGLVQFEYDFKGDSFVEIDCQEMDATMNGLSRNKQIKIGYEFPQLQIGNNIVKILKGAPTVEIKVKDRWL